MAVPKATKPRKLAVKRKDVNAPAVKSKRQQLEAKVVRRASELLSAEPKSNARAASALHGAVELLNPKNTSTRRVLIIEQGGTIGMERLPDGSLELRPGFLSKQIKVLTELFNQRMPRCDFVEMNSIIDSADMGPEDWTKIASVVQAHYYDYDGFVILHGTDTLAYTASALSFMLEQLAKPVVLTGAQLPFVDPVSDARQNFIGAVVFAGFADICEVCVFFNGQLMRGNRTMKTDASSLNAFAAPSHPPLAEMGTPINIYERRLLDPPRGRFRLQPIQGSAVLVVWVVPGIRDDFFDCLAKSKGMKGIVLLLYGCGNCCSKKVNFLKSIKRLVDAGVVVIAGSQCGKGTVELDKYAVGKAFSEVGVVSAGNMTTEAIVTKLAYLFAKGLSQKLVNQFMVDNLRGELTADATTLNLQEPVSSLSTF